MMVQTLRLCQVFYWRHRLSLTLLVGYVLSVGPALWIGGERWSQEVATLLALSVAGPAALLALSILSFAHDLDLAQRGSAFPRWWFALPIATWRLALVPIALLAIVILLGWGIARVALSPTMAGGVPWSAALWTSLGLGSWMQWLSWTPVRHPLARLGPLLVLASVTAVAGLILFSTDAELLRGIAGGAYFLAGALAATRAVHRARHGDVVVSEGLGERAWFSWIAPGTDAPFSTPAAAMRWRDHRQVTRLFPWLTWGVGLLALLIAPTRPNIAGAFLILQAPALLALTCGSAFGRSSVFHGNSRLPTYLAILPVTTWQMCLARLHVILTAGLRAWSMTLPALAIWWLLHGRHLAADIETRLRGLDPTHPIWKYVVAVLLLSLFMTLSLPIASAWITAAGRGWLETVVNLMGAFLILGGVIAGLTTFSTLTSEGSLPSYLEAWRQRMPVYLWGALAAKTVLLTALCRYVLHRNLVPATALAGLGAYFLAGPLLLTGVLHLLLPVWMEGHGARWALLTLLTPASSVLMFVAMLDWNRHR